MGPDTRSADVRGRGHGRRVGDPAARVLRGMDHARVRPGPQRGAVGQLRGDGGHSAQTARSGRLLDFRSYADYALSTRMAHTVEEVMQFLHELAQSARSAAQQDFAELESFAG